ncbi:hypothetical protein [Absidia glauca]|uniref:Uncharacterized protein n=1 Tax=Absidia glauca TaxID=4829 RepID=A0A168RPK8_ABSGL|nr:hypothetical protein [Absidia glauca]
MDPGNIQQDQVGESHVKNLEKVPSDIDTEMVEVPSKDEATVEKSAPEKKAESVRVAKEVAERKLEQYVDEFNQLMLKNLDGSVPDHLFELNLTNRQRWGSIVKSFETLIDNKKVFTKAKDFQVPTNLPVLQLKGDVDKNPKAPVVS